MEQRYNSLMEKAYRGEFLTQAEENWIENLHAQDAANKAFAVRTEQLN